ncbi:lipoprotein [Thiohalocapsa sp. ML1]|jgi:predicted small lipoprotein YifL|uniref:LPS translocon maturation chaperone LptM n=1 Tax=Thiohalocapsa sp. ML1 TaxID=1431688 RepID=UPI000731F553|nr:lipoprotein [Thiohalocapsa sp. ML1]
MQRLRPPLPLLTALLATLLLGACGQKGDLYLAEDDPARAERDARARGKSFPFPAEDAPWPPPASEAAPAPAAP